MSNSVYLFSFYFRNNVKSELDLVLQKCLILIMQKEKKCISFIQFSQTSLFMQRAPTFVNKKKICLRNPRSLVPGRFFHNTTPDKNKAKLLPSRTTSHQDHSRPGPLPTRTSINKQNHSSGPIPIPYGGELFLSWHLKNKESKRKPVLHFCFLFLTWKVLRFQVFFWCQKPSAEEISWKSGALSNEQATNIKDWCLWWASVQIDPHFRTHSLFRWMQ